MQKPRTLQPVKIVKSDYEDLESYILKIMKNFYQQIIGKSKKILNSNDALEDAIISGKLVYSKDGFIGEFNTRTSKRLRDLGARWNPIQKMWKIPASMLPGNILNAIAQGKIKNDSLVEELKKKLDEAELPIFQFEKAMQNIIKSFTKKTDETLENKEVPIVSKQLDETEEEAIKRKYTENMELNIKNWKDEEVIRLRKLIEENYAKGIRYENIVKKIAFEFNVPAKKAKFLARQETHLLSAEIKEQKYKKAGLKKYIWKTLNFPTGFNPKNVRPSHAALNDKVFEFDNPPITDPITGARNNPGQDFNCRCVALPILD